MERFIPQYSLFFSIRARDSKLNLKAEIHTLEILKMKN